MSGNYVPLYRKYRPQTLDKLVGQEHIKKTLTSAIELGKIAHAFLFTGPRGKPGENISTGKNSCKIFELQKRADNSSLRRV